MARPSELDRLGDLLEAAISQEQVRSRPQRAATRTPTGHRRSARAALAACAIVAVLVGAALLRAQSREDVDDLATVDADAPWRAAPEPTSGSDLTPMTDHEFTTGVFLRSPAFVDTGARCRTDDGRRFTCSLDRAPTIDRGDESHLFLDGDRRIAGACRSQTSDLLTWVCSLGSLTIEDDLLVLGHPDADADADAHRGGGP